MWLELVEPVDHRDCQRQVVVAVIVIPAAVRFPRVPLIRATVKQVRYEPHLTVVALCPHNLGTKNRLLNTKRL
jgi:hypothetical protein